MYRYEALTAKTKCLMGKLLSEEDLLYLAGVKNVEDIAVYLREKTAYGETLRGMNMKQTSRRKLEYYIKKTLLADYLKMHRFTHGEDRKYIALLLGKYEIEYMLNAWRRVNNPEIMTETEDGISLRGELLELYFIHGQKSSGGTNLDLGLLKNAENPRDFLRAVSGTEYHAVFAAAKQGDFAEIEHTIYAGYYKKLIKAAETFGDSLMTVLTAATDLKNLERIYRMRYNFGMTPENTMNWLIPFRYKLKKTDIGELINITDPKKYLARCNATYYGRKVDFTASPVSVCGSLYLYNLYKSTALKNSSSFDVVVKYFYIKETEIENLIFIIEGTRYEMLPEEIKTNLII